MEKFTFHTFGKIKKEGNKYYLLIPAFDIDIYHCSINELINSAVRIFKHKFNDEKKFDIYAFLIGNYKLDIVLKQKE
jgi:hypothetical protein